jgi:hypothetical protein
MVDKSADDQKRDDVLKRLLKTPPKPKKTTKREPDLPLGEAIDDGGPRGESKK